LGRIGLDLAAELAHENAQVMGVVDMLIAPDFA
jgi:UDP-N-acetyl-D-mannosaminuronate dehydrogenase